MPGVEKGTLPVSRAEPHTMPERNVGAPLPTQDEALLFEDDLDELKKSRTSIMQWVASPDTGGQGIPKETPIPAQLTPPHSPAAPEVNEDEDDFHTPPGSPMGTGRLSPPLITSRSSPGERLVPEGESNVFQQSMHRYPGK